MPFDQSQPYANVTTDAGNIYYLQGGVFYKPRDFSVASPAPVDYVVNKAAPIYATINSPAKTSAYTATAADSTIICDATAAGFVINLPSAATVPGLMLTIKKIDATANGVVTDAFGAELIDNAATISITTQYQAVMIQSDGAKWWVISSS